MSGTLRVARLWDSYKAQCNLSAANLNDNVDLGPHDDEIIDITCHPKYNVLLSLSASFKVNPILISFLQSF